MAESLKNKLQQLARAVDIHCLNNIAHGIEKESLRVDSDGHIAQTSHPAGLGSPLTHPHITTDFAEALVEFITPVYSRPDDSLNFLADLHRYLYMQLENDELLWTSSMPCIIDDEDAVLLARYGSSNIGRMKTLYRSGLAYRYGKAMQTIAGIHFNFSLPDRFWIIYRELHGSTLSLQDFKTDQYFHLIRNFHRFSWLLLYLFGASPAVCKSFVKNKPDHGLDEFDDASAYLPYATSLRMGDLGYTSKAQSGLYVSYNNLDEYLEGLTRAVGTPYPPYEQFARDENGEPLQLNSNLLQIENEFYSTIRPKREAPSGMRPIQVLREAGVEYVEVRCLDLNPFLRLGIDQTQIYFLNSFLLYCLLKESPPSNEQEDREVERNLETVVGQGRRPDVTLLCGGEEVPLRNWGLDIMSETMAVAELLDAQGFHSMNRNAVNAQMLKLNDSSLTPSARVLQQMRDNRQRYFEFAMEQSAKTSTFFTQSALNGDKLKAFEEASRKSVLAREATEKQDTLDFEEFLRRANEL